MSEPGRWSSPVRRSHNLPGKSCERTRICLYAQKNPREIPHPTREEIELRAYQIYVERGGAQGHDLDDWLQAERELIEKYAKTGRKAKGAVV